MYIWYSCWGRKDNIGKDRGKTTPRITPGIFYYVVVANNIIRNINPKIHQSTRMIFWSFLFCTIFFWVMLVGISVMVVLIVGVSRTDIFINDIFCPRIFGWSSFIADQNTICWFFYKGLKIYTHIFQNIPYCPEKVHIESFSLYNDIFIPQFQLFQFGTQIIKEDLGIR